MRSLQEVSFPGVVLVMSVDKTEIERQTYRYLDKLQRNIRVRYTFGQSINQSVNQSNLIKEKYFTGHVDLKETTYPCPQNKKETLTL